MSKSASDWIASAPLETQAEFLDGLSREEILALPYLFEFWALEHQLAPEGAWRTWLIMGGRGAGKTRAGSEWVRRMVEGPKPLSPGRAKRVALVGETHDEAREVMVMGPSGIIACSPPDRRPRWEASRRRLVWPNGAVAETYSASDPEGLRGPQFDAAWADELAKWPKGEDTWDQLQFALRLGEHPQAVVTTTPRNVPVLKRLMTSPSTVVSRAPTEANRANLADSFLREVRARYRGSALERQELDGVLLEDVEGALWTLEMLEAVRLAEAPALGRIVVAVDPPTTSNANSDACGIVVAGADTTGAPTLWRGYVLEDATVQAARPTEWAERAVEAFRRHEADAIVAEVNQGGDLVETVIRQVDPSVPVRSVRATRGKIVRAEPVAALYAQKRVFHAGPLGALEDQMRQMTVGGYNGRGSPDRVDALVWAITELMIRPASSYHHPQVRALT